MTVESQTLKSGASKSISRLSRKKIEQANKFIALVILIGLGFLYIFPFYWTLVTALKTDIQVYQWPPSLYPPTPQWINFLTATNYIPYWLYMRNTFVICFFFILGNLVSVTLVAYGFSRIQFRGRDLIFLIYLSTIMLPAPVTLIPLYILYMKLGWIGTILPLVVPSYFGTSVAFVFMLRQFFRTIPTELSEAAFMDGASDLRILWEIMLPLCKPALATIALLSFIGAYQDFLGPLIYLTNQDQWTIAIGLQLFKNMYTQQWQLMMAAAILAMLPMIILYFFTQRTLIQGIALTGIKG